VYCQLVANHSSVGTRIATPACTQPLLANGLPRNERMLQYVSQKQHSVLHCSTPPLSSHPHLRDSSHRQQLRLDPRVSIQDNKVRAEAWGQLSELILSTRGERGSRL